METDQEIKLTTLNDLFGISEMQNKEIQRKIEAAYILKDDFKDILAWLKIDKLPEAKRLLILQGCYLFKLLKENDERVRQKASAEEKHETPQEQEKTI
jgi:hypothetical protein